VRWTSGAIGIITLTGTSRQAVAVGYGASGRTEYHGPPSGLRPKLA